MANDIVNTIKIGSTSYGLEDVRVDVVSSLPSSGGTEDIKLVPQTAVTIHTNSNGWTWVTRTDGITECWFKYTLSDTTINTAWGSFYYKNNVLPTTNLTYPVTFKELPVVTWGGDGSNRSFWILAGAQTAGTTTKLPNIGLMRSTTGTVGTPVITAHVIGEV